jgi:uncharacterized protein
MDDWTRQALAERLGEKYLNARIAEQVRRTLGIKGHGRGRLHLENLPGLFKLLRFLLRITGLMVVGQRNAFDLQVREREVRVPGLPASLDGLRVLQLTDLHLDGLPGLGANTARRIAGQRFDLAVLTGDYRFRTTGAYAPVEAELSDLIPALACRFGVYGILGNHDFIEMVPLLQRYGVHMLVNEAVRIGAPDGEGDDALWLVGLDDPHFYGLHDFTRALLNVPDGATRLLLVHSPEVIPEAAAHDFPVYLCGHTHAGQICLPNGAPVMVNARCPRRYAAGAWQYDGVDGYTSAGVGGSGVVVRFFCPPEVVIHVLRAE